MIAKDCALQKSSPVPALFLIALLGLSACASLTDPGVSRYELEKKSQQRLAAGNLSSAEKTTQTLIAHYGPSPFLLNQMAVIRERQGRLRETLWILAYAHRLYPANRSITLNLATEEVEQGKVFQSREILRAIMNQKHWPAGFRTLMGRIDIATGNLPEARIFLHEALTRHPNNPLILSSMGLLHERMGLATKARRDFRKALDQAPEGKLKQHLRTLLAAD
jgi:predicted Zn-dependent protease